MPDIKTIADRADIIVNGYAFPFQADGRRVIKVGVLFNPDTRIPEDWLVAKSS